MESQKDILMENKYFTPDIEDIRVGYECEIYEQKSRKLIKDVGWHTVKVTLGNSEYGESVAINRILNYIKQNKLRTRYLNKEQIEAEGWIELISTTPITQEVESAPTWTFLSKEDCTMIFKVDCQHIQITKGSKTIFSGECKCINTLRYIEKLLNIK